MAFPISYEEFVLPDLRFIMIGNYHQPIPNESEYAKVLQHFLDHEEQRGSHPVVLIEHNVKSKAEDYREGSYLRLLRSYYNSESTTPSRPEVIPIDGRKEGYASNLRHLLKYSVW